MQQEILWSAVQSLDIGAAPFVRLVSNSGKVGETVEILGQGFTETSSVSFNGARANSTFVAKTYMTAIVPAGATSGAVIVTTPSGVLTSNNAFRVTP